MENNTFKLDTEKSAKRSFLKRVNVAFSSAIVLTSIISVAHFIFLIRGISEQAWKELSVAGFVEMEFAYLSMFCIFISLIKILMDNKPFSKTLTYCIRIISVLYFVGAILFPRLSGYESSGFDILRAGDFVLIDGKVLLFGLLLYIFSVLIEEGFKMQKELDEIL